MNADQNRLEVTSITIETQSIPTLSIAGGGRVDRARAIMDFGAQVKVKIDFSNVWPSPKSPNRVAGGFSPPAPTAPRMRVRTGRVLRIGKDSPMTEMSSKAGYDTRARDVSPGRVQYARERRAARSLPKVRAFTLSHPLRWAFGYYALC